MTNRAPLVVVIGATLAIALAGCGSSGSSKSSPTAASSGSQTTTPKANVQGTLTNADGWPRVEGLRGKRYCEVLLARIVDAHLNAEVWNSYGLNDCPEAEWKALDPAAIKTERNVVAALLNGPRYWLMDAIEKKPSGERETTTFGTLEMFRAATVDLGPIPPKLDPYTERHVARDTVFEFAKGSQVYELVNADGAAYIMQSYSQQSDPTLTEAALAGLASRLKPPPGWTYRVRTLDATFRLLAVGAATVVQDDLSNTYQGEPN